MRYLVLLFIVLLSSCERQTGDRITDLTKVKLQLNWMAEAEHGGYYEALLNGYYLDEGLEVEIIPGGPGVRVETETALQRVAFGIANADKVLIVRDKGMKLQALMSPYATSPRCLIYHREHPLESFAELVSAEVLILNNTKPFYHWLVSKYPALADKDTIPYNKATFMANKTAVIQGYINSEPLIFEDKGLDVGILKIADTGFNPYASVLICSADFKAQNEDLVARMKKASVKGWLSYLKSPQATNKHIEAINPANKGTLNSSTAALLELMAPQDEKFGQMQQARWLQLARQLKDIGLISRIPPDLLEIID